MPRSLAPRAVVALSAGAALCFGAALLAACEPTVRGLCKASSQCRAGASCSEDGICLAASGQCAPACNDGEICSSGACEALRPVVTLSAPADGIVSPAHAALTVTITASPLVPLGALQVEVSSDHVIASATVSSPQPGANAVVLQSFQSAPFEGQVTLVASLGFARSDGTPDVAQSLTVPATYDSIPPAIAAITFPPLQGAVNGWFASNGAPIEVSAEVVDGAQGTGPRSATLTLDACSARGPCSYAGALVAASQPVTFSFALPRSLQSAGSEAPIPFHVTATDRAGNSAEQAGALQIDARPPTFGAVTLVTAGQPGEDGHTVWFAAGPSAPPIEVSVALADLGAGLDPASIALRLNAADVDVDPGLVAPILPLPVDGTVHFLVPATAVVAREAAVRFSATASDLLAQVATLPESAATTLHLDAAAPSVSLASVNYGSAQPAWTAVCGAAQSDLFECGRGPEAAPARALRDDTVTASFDVIDCGVGLAAAGAPAAGSFSLTTGGATLLRAASGFTALPSTCANGSTNPLHHYSFTLQLGSDLPALDEPDADGVVAVLLQSIGRDLLGQVATAQPAAGASGPGVLDIARVRWRRQVGQASGAPLLLAATTPGAGRSVALGTAAASGDNVLAVRPDGSLDSTLQLALTPPVQGELALGETGTLYAVTGVSRSCAAGSCGTVYLLAPGAAAVGCDVANAVFGASPAVVQLGSGNGEAAIGVPTTRQAADPNVYTVALSGASCHQSGFALPIGGSDDTTLTGVTGASGLLFFAHAGGFSSAVQAGGALGLPVVDFADTLTDALAPPALNGGASVDKLQPIYPSSGAAVRRTVYQPACGGTTGAPPCWANAWTSSGAGKAGVVALTPVFDETQVVATDQTGVVTAWDLTTGAQLWQTEANGSPVSGPVLVAAGAAHAALLLGGDGRLRRVSAPEAAGGAPGDVTLLEAGAFAPAGTVPAFPVVDGRGSGGVAYFIDGAGWLYALQLDDAPVLADGGTWPRPSRDSCNSRSADSSCQ